MAKRIIATASDQATPNVINGVGESPNHSKMIERARKLGIKADATTWWCDRYVGTAEALVAAGIVTPDQLPGRPGGPKTSATFYRGEPSRNCRQRDENYINIVRRSKGRYEVVVGLHREVKRYRERVWDEARKAKLHDEAKQASASITERLNATMTAERFRQYLTDQVLRLWRDISMNTETSSFPFVLSDGDMERARCALIEAHAILKTVPIYSLKATSECLAKAKEDSAFQEFLSNQGLRFDRETQHG